MSTARKLLIGGAVVLVLGLVVAVSVLSGDEEKGTEVYLAQARRTDLVSSVSATGRIEPRTKVEVQSSVIGEIVKLPVREGDRVRKGDLLVQIDPETYRAEAERLEANLRLSRIEVARHEAGLVNLRATLRRHKQLSAQGIVPDDLLEKTELDVRTGEIQLDALKEEVSQAGSSLAKARDELRKTTITTPIDGVVTQLNAELGEITMTGTMNNPGTVIMTVSDLGEILAEVDVDETRVVQVEPGQHARVVVDAIGETHPYAGRVVEIAGTALKRQGSDVQIFAVKIALDAPDARLRPGMTAKARVETQRAEGAVVVPIQAVMLKPVREVEKALTAQAEASGKAGKDAKAGKDGKGGKDAEAAKAGKAGKDGKATAAEPASVRTSSSTSPSSAPPASSPATGTAPSAKDTASGGRTLDPGQREVVYRVVDGKAVLTPVRTGISDETDVVVLEGLSADDSLVTGPYRTLKKLKDGEAVRKKDEGKKEGDGEGDEESEGEEGDSGVEVEVD